MADSVGSEPTSFVVAAPGPRCVSIRRRHRRRRAQFYTFLYFEAARVVFHEYSWKKQLRWGVAFYRELLHFIGEKLIYEDR
jgi:hypothetical protein